MKKCKPTELKTLRLYEEDIKAFSEFCKKNKLTQAKGMNYLLENCSAK